MEGVAHGFIPTADHRALRYCETTFHARATMVTYHTQTHSLVAIHQVTEILAGSGNGYPLLIPQLMESALNPEIRLPILTIGYTTRSNVKSTLGRIQGGGQKDPPAPPAIVPRRYGLISMTFFTVPDAIVV